MSAANVAMKVLELAQQIPRDKANNIAGQMIHYSSTVCHNLLEAWKNRTDQAVFMDKLNNASIEAVEVQSRIRAAIDAKFLKPEAAEKIAKTYEDLVDKIGSILKNPNEQAK